MPPKLPSVPPVAPTLPPMAPSLPPHPPPPPSSAHARSLTSQKPKRKSEHSRHVKFDDKAINSHSQAMTTVVPPAAPITSFVPHGTIREVVHEHGPVVELKTSPGGKSGYIRLQGGFQTQRYHNYDALIPTTDLFQANSEQQTGVVNAMLAAQLANLSTTGGLGHHLYHDRERVAENNNTRLLTATNLQKIPGHDARAPSDTLTSISRRPPNSKHAATKYQSNELPKNDHPPTRAESKASRASQREDLDKKVLTCFNCEGHEHVKEIADSFRICWNCLRMLYPRQAVHVWKTGQWRS